MRAARSRFAITCAAVALLFVGAIVAQLGSPSDALGNDDKKREIVCWGDSMTEGMGAGKAYIMTDFEKYDASDKSYPEILEHFTGLKTYNFGVSGAKSNEIAFMQGGLTSLEIESASSDGDDVGNDANDADEDAYDEDEDFLDFGPTIDYDVMEAGKDHLGDVLILEIGSNGGWNGDYATLIAQYRAMIKHAKCSDYIILGDTDDPGTSIADRRQKPFKKDGGSSETAWEKALLKEFGDHFVNMRIYLIRNGLSDAGLTPSFADKLYAAQGRISPQLRADWTHLNSYGYYAKAKAVFERGAKLGYW